MTINKLGPTILHDLISYLRGGYNIHADMEHLYLFIGRHIWRVGG